MFPLFLKADRLKAWRLVIAVQTGIWRLWQSRLWLPFQIALPRNNEWEITSHEDLGDFNIAWSCLLNDLIGWISFGSRKQVLDDDSLNDLLFFGTKWYCFETKPGGWPSWSHFNYRKLFIFMTTSRKTMGWFTLTQFEMLNPTCTQVTSLSPRWRQRALLEPLQLNRNTPNTGEPSSCCHCLCRCSWLSEAFV